MNNLFRLSLFTIVVIQVVIISLFTTCIKPEREVQIITLDTTGCHISYTSAILKGEITDEGSGKIDDYGIILSENAALLNPTPKGLGAANSKGKFEIPFNDLKKNTTYYFKAYVSVESKTKLANNIVQFKTKDTQTPTVTAGSITGINMTSASLSGEVTSDGGEPQIKRGLCWGTSSNPTVSSCIDTTVNGSGTGVFTGKITGLTPGTQYYVRTYASNLKGISYNSADILFKTHSLPVLTTTIVSGISNTGAVSGGNITDDGGSAILSRGVCWGTSTGPTIALTTKTSEAAGTGIFTSTLTGLIPLTTYYLRAYATNEYGTSYGNELTLTSTKAPVTVTNPATTILNTSAVLNGSVNANSFTSTVTFEYGLTTSYGSVINAIPGTVTGTSATSVQATINSLNPGITYHYRVKAVNSGGTSYGDDLSFITQQPPASVTASATNITTSSATLNGTVNANNLSSAVTFEYGTTTSYGSSIAGTPGTGTGNSPTPVSADISGLSPNTTYHYRIVGTSSGGTTPGNDMTFNTPALPPPSVTTGSATTISSTAVLNGTVNANGYSSVVSFEYGTTASYGSTAIANESPVTGNTPISVTANISGLTPSTTYHFRVQAVSSAGTAVGNDEIFTTSALPTTVTDYEGNIYNTIQIGSQIWMQENLKVTYFNNGEIIPIISDNTIWNSSTSGAYCWYNNDRTTYKNLYGALYNWYAVTDVRNICPVGWHSSSKEDWLSLSAYLGGYVAGKLKEPGTVHWSVSDPGSTNESGFTALPGGVRTNSGLFLSIGNAFENWTSTIDAGGKAWYSGISGLLGLGLSIANYNYGLSIRCIQGGIPLATTLDASAIISTSATLNGSVNANNSTADVMFEYGNSTSYDHVVIPTQSPAIGSTPTQVTINITGLTPSTTIHYRVKATTSSGTTYGIDKTFTTNATVSDNEGNIYETAIIGTQIWLANNLRSTKYSDGTLISSVYPGGVSVYNNNEGYAFTYGRLYTQSAAMDGAANSNLNPSGVRGACPTGWHVPSNLEWYQMESLLGWPSGSEPTLLGGKVYVPPNDNSTGFSAVLSGMQWPLAPSYVNFGQSAFYWSASGSAKVLDNGWMTSRSTPGESYSIRCVKD